MLGVYGLINYILRTHEAKSGKTPSEAMVCSRRQCLIILDTATQLVVNC